MALSVFRRLVSILQLQIVDQARAPKPRRCQNDQLPVGRARYRQILLAAHTYIIRAEPGDLKLLRRLCLMIRNIAPWRTLDLTRERLQGCI